MSDSNSVRAFTDYSYAYNILTQVIPYLDIEDLVACSQVCEIWKAVVKQSHIWSAYKLQACGRHLNNVLRSLEEFARNIELNDIFVQENKDFFRVICGAESVVHLSLFNVPYEFLQKLGPSWDSLEELEIVEKNCDASTMMPLLNMYKFAENLTSLNIETSCPILLKDLNFLKQLKHLYVDADYSKGFFCSIENKFLVNLESFGVGYSNYKNNTDIRSLYNIQLSSLLLTSLKNMHKLKLSNLESDFLILATVSKLPQLKELDLTLTNAWNHYSFFLSMCTNIKKLSVTLVWLQERISSVFEIAAQNSILFGTVKTLKDTLTDFTCIFDAGYMTESELEIAIDNNEWRHSYTTIWDNVFDFNPCNESYSYIQSTFKDISCVELSLDDLKTVVSKGMPNVRNVEILTNKYRKKCQYCVPESRENVSMHVLKILRIDRQRARWLQSRFRHLPLNRIR